MIMKCGETVDLKYLTTFKAIVTQGGFSKAARELNYTQSTITFQVQQLEQELSVRLFEKLGRNMVLTDAGRQLIPYVDEVLACVEKLHGFDASLAGLRGDLRVAVGETLLCYRMPPVLKRFHRLAPDARLYLRSMNCCDIRDALLDGSVDLGVFYRDVGGLDGLRVEPVGEYPLTLVASPRTKAAFPDFVTPGRRIPVPLIINEPNCVFRQIFEAYLRERDITLDHTIELVSIPTIKNLVESDVGVSYLPSFAVERELESGELQVVETGLEGRSITAVCGWHKNKWISPLMRLMVELMTGVAAPEQDH